MQPRSGLVQSADAQIFYLEYPSPHPHAQTLILLHGNGEDHRYFARQIAAFSARFRLVLMDTRGQGRSSAGRGKLNFSVFAQDLCGLLSPFSQNFRQKQQILGLMVNHPHISPHQLAALTMPALVIVGQHDMIRHQHSLLIAHSLPRSRFVCLPGADHFCAAKQPEAFNREVLSFLSAL